MEGIAAHTQPYFQALFIRFDDEAMAHALGAAPAFDARVIPDQQPRIPTAPRARLAYPPMMVYRGLFVTIAAGD